MQVVIGLLSEVRKNKGVVALIDQAIASATNFLTGVIIGRSCTKGEFGLYMLGLTIVLLAMELQMSLISTPYMVYSPHLKDHKLRLYIGSSMIHQFALSAVVILTLAASGGILSLGFGPPGLGPVVWVLVAIIGFIMFREFVRRVCFAGLKMELALLFDICVAVIQMVGVIILYCFGFLSVSRAYWVIGCACGIGGVGWLSLQYKTFDFRIGQAISDFKRNWKFGKWVFASGVVWTVSVTFYPWFLTVFHGTGSAGIWAACLGVIALTNVPLVGMQNFLGPKIANVFAAGGLRPLRRFTFQSSLFLCIVMTPLCCALCVFGRPLLVLLYGDKYAGNGSVVSILALSLVAGAVGFSFSRALFAIERADVDFKINFAPLFILLTFGLWLVRSFGPLGAASGLLLANVAALGLRWASFSILTSRPSVEGASS